MFEFVQNHSQPIGDHSLWPCPLRAVSNFIRHACGKHHGTTNRILHFFCETVIMRSLWYVCLRYLKNLKDT